MVQLAAILLALAAGVTLVYWVLSAFVRAWVAHRVRVVMLSEYAAQRDAGDPDTVGRALDAAAPRHDDYRGFLIMAAFLAPFGLVSIGASRICPDSQLAAGLYLGGYGCIGLAMFLAAVAGVLHRLNP